MRAFRIRDAKAVSVCRQIKINLLHFRLVRICKIQCFETANPVSSVDEALKDALDQCFGAFLLGLFKLDIVYVDFDFV